MMPAILARGNPHGSPRLPAPAPSAGSSSLFAADAVGPLDVQSTLEKFFGDQAQQVIEDLFRLKEEFKDLQSEAADPRLLKFLKSLVFTGNQGNRRIQFRAGLKQENPANYRDVQDYLKDYLDSSELKTIREAISSASRAQVLRAVSVAALVVIGVVIAVGLWGSCFPISPGLCIGLGILALGAPVGAQLWYQSRQEVLTKSRKDAWASTQRDLDDLVSGWRLLVDIASAGSLPRPAVAPPTRALVPSEAVAPRHALVSVALGVDVHAKDREGRTALHRAAKAGNEAQCRDLLAAGADVNVTDNEGCTPLYWAASGYPQLCRLLLEAGANPNLSTNNYRTPLHDSIPFCPDKDGKHLLICKLLLDAGADVHAKNRDGYTAFWLAAMWGQEAICSLLLSRGAAVDAKSEDEETALAHWAKFPRKLAMGRLLLKAGANPNTLDKQGHTPLNYTVGRVPGAYNVHGGSAAACALLLKAGADMLSRSDRQDSLWCRAIKVGDVAICQVFIDAGAPVNAGQGQLWAPPLYDAIRLENIALCRILLKAGADMCRIWNGQPLWEKVVESNNQNLVQAFFEMGSDVNVKLLLAAYCKHIPYFAIALQGGADLGFIRDYLSAPQIPAEVKARIVEFLSGAEARGILQSFRQDLSLVLDPYLISDLANITLGYVDVLL